MKPAIALVLFLAACGGSSSEPAAPTPAADPAPAAPADDQAKLRAAQDHAVEAMCERLVECSIEDARRTMSPEELKKLNPEELRPKAESECRGEYGATSLSPRQIKTIQGCVNEAAECAALDACLSGAGK